MSRSSGGHSSIHAWVRRLRVLSILLQRDTGTEELIRRLEQDFDPDPAFDTPEAAVHALRRDIQYLRRIPGCRIMWDRRRQVYCLTSSPVHIRLTEEDLHTLQILRGLFQAELPHRWEVLALIDKIAAQASPDQARKLQRDSPLSFPGLSEDASEFRQELERIERAIQRRQDVEFNYKAASAPDEIQAWRVQPVDLRIADNHLYLDAWDHEDHRGRLFRVDRIVRGSLTVHPQVRPDILPRRTPINLRLRVSPALVPYGIARRWPGRKEEVQADGSAIVEIPMPSVFEAVRLLERYGAEVECLGPPEVRTQMEETVRNLYRMYFPQDS